MGRHIKIGLDYFPLDVNIDDNLELIEAEHGLSGFAIVVKLWQKIYSNGYYIEWNPDSVLLFSKKINSELTLINSVLNSCFIRKIFDKNLYERYGILTSSGIQKRYLLACSQSKRKSIIFYSEFKLINSEFTELITDEMRFIQEESTQSKVKESKVNESKENKKITPIEFYKNEIEKSGNNPNYKTYVNALFGENEAGLKLSGVLSLRDQMSYDQFQKLIAKAKEKGESLIKLTMSFENGGYWKTKKSLYLSINDWLNKR